MIFGPVWAAVTREHSDMSVEISVLDCEPEPAIGDTLPGRFYRTLVLVQDRQIGELDSRPSRYQPGTWIYTASLKEEYHKI